VVHNINRQEKTKFIVQSGVVTSQEQIEPQAIIQKPLKMEGLFYQGEKQRRKISNPKLGEIQVKRCER